jgi:hypothetical protein
MVLTPPGTRLVSFTNGFVQSSINVIPTVAIHFQVSCGNGFTVEIRDELRDHSWFVPLGSVEESSKI